MSCRVNFHANGFGVRLLNSSYNARRTRIASSFAKSLKNNVTFPSPPTHSPSDPVATILSLYASRPVPGPAGSGRSQTIPRWLLPATDNQIGKDQTGPDLNERSPHSSMSPNRPIVSSKSSLSSPITSTRPLTIRSWPEALNAWVSRRASRMPTIWNACSLVIVYARVWL